MALVSGEVTSPVRTAVVGYGYWGVNLARNVATARNLELAVVVDADASRRAAVADHLPGVAATDDLEGVLGDPDVEAVVLATPASTHASLGLRSIDAGKHVLVEKPLAMTVGDGERLVAAAEQAHVVLMVGHTFLYSPPVLMLRQHIAEGDLGAIQYLYSQRLSLGRIRRDCNALWNFAPHDLSIMLHLLGEVPIEVSARGFDFIEPGIEDVYFASLVFPSGVGANLHVSWIDPRKTRLMTIVGDQKMAIYNDVSVDQKIWIVDAGVARDAEFGAYESLGDFQWRTRAGDIVIPKIDMTEPLRAEVEELGRCVRTGQRPRTDGRHGLDVVRTLVAIEESGRAGGSPVKVSG